MHGLFLSAKLSGCQFSTPKTPPTFSLSPHLVMSHCIFQCILAQTCGGEVLVEVVVVAVVGGFIDARETRRLALTNELSGQTSSEWE